MKRQVLFTGLLTIFSLAKPMNFSSGHPMDENYLAKREERVSKLYDDVIALNKEAKALSLEKDEEKYSEEIRNIVTKLESKQEELSNILLMDKHQSNVERLAQQDKELDRLQIEAKNIHARMKELTSKIQSSDKDIIKKSETIIDTFNNDFKKLKSKKKNIPANQNQTRISNRWNMLSGIYNYVRDMRVIEMLFGIRPQTKIQRAFDHEVSELRNSLKNVKNQLKKNPDNKMLLDQKKLVKDEIDSFTNPENKDSFIKSSMKRIEFIKFQQNRLRE